MPDPDPCADAGAVLRRLLDDPLFAEGDWWHRECHRPGAQVFGQGDRGRDLYLVLSGTARVSGELRLDDQGRRMRPGFSDLAPGDVFGELALFDAEPRSARVTALSELELAQLDAGRLLTFFELHPDLGYRTVFALARGLVGRLRASNDRSLALLAWGLKAHGVDRHL